VLLAGVKAAGTNSGSFLSRASALQELKLRQCGLQSISEPVLQLTALRYLDVASNAVTQVNHTQIISRPDISLAHHCSLPPRTPRGRQLRVNFLGAVEGQQQCVNK
jgi:hypothetical protein